MIMERDCGGDTGNGHWPLLAGISEPGHLLIQKFPQVPAALSVGGWKRTGGAVDFRLVSLEFADPDWQVKTRKRGPLGLSRSPLRDHCGCLSSEIEVSLAVVVTTLYPVHILVDTAVLLLTTVDPGVNIQNRISQSCPLREGLS